MPREKTSKAQIKSMRLNPDTSEQDAEVLRIIDHWKEQGYDFKQLASDRILRSEGYTPEMFSTTTNMASQIISSLEGLLAQFAQEIIEQVGKSGGAGGAVDYDDEDTRSMFASNLARSFMQRKQQALGDDDE